MLHLNISKYGKIDTEKADRAFEKMQKRIQQENDELVERMRQWLLPEVLSAHKRRYRENLKMHPVYLCLSDVYNVDLLKDNSPLFDQRIEGEQMFTLDHRLWQAYLFFTEIFQCYRRSGKYDSGLKKPQIYISSIVQKKLRRPDHPFRKMIGPYINYSLLKAKSVDPRTFSPILYPHEIIYEYLDRLSGFGFLRNKTSRYARKTSVGKYEGRFEVQFDCYDPVIFNTEDQMIRFFLEYQLVYRNKRWHDIRSGKNFY